MNGRFVAIIPIMIATTLIIASTLTYIPQKVYRMEWFSSAGNEIVKVFPQGWSFFTKSPTASKATFFARRGTSLVEIDHAGNGLSDAFGINRSFRNFQAENEFLERVLQDEPTIECEDQDIEKCLEGNHDDLRIEIDNPYESSAICGEVIMVSETPVPWHWRNLYEERYHVTGVSEVHVSC